VVILPNQIVQLPISAGAEKWAITAIEGIDRGKFLAQKSVEHMQKTDFSLEHGLSSLLDIYSAGKAEANVAES
jgi:hypothetical protein